MKEDISPSMLAFDYGKLAIEINVGIVVVYNRKLLLRDSRKLVQTNLTI